MTGEISLTISVKMLFLSVESSIGARQSRYGWRFENRHQLFEPIRRRA
jgi:hypothetical protein